MTANIQTIFFDVGNTLRIVLPDQEFIDRAEAGLMELIGTTESHDALFAKLEERWKRIPQAVQDHPAGCFRGRTVDPVHAAGI